MLLLLLVSCECEEPPFLPVNSDLPDGRFTITETSAFVESDFCDYSYDVVRIQFSANPILTSKSIVVGGTEITWFGSYRLQGNTLDLRCGIDFVCSSDECNLEIEFNEAIIKDESGLLTLDVDNEGGTPTLEIFNVSVGFCRLIPPTVLYPSRGDVVEVFEEGPNQEVIFGMKFSQGIDTTTLRFPNELSIRVGSTFLSDGYSRWESPDSLTYVSRPGILNGQFCTAAPCDFTILIFEDPDIGIGANGRPLDGDCDREIDNDSFYTGTVRVTQ